jgi:hypothetical protein
LLQRGQPRFERGPDAVDRIGHVGRIPECGRRERGEPGEQLACGRRVDLVRDHGHRNIAAALRYYARHTTPILPLPGITSP